jgi:hypothetical protein
MWRGRAWRRRAGQAFELGERTWRTGPPPSSFAAGCRGPRQDGQAAKTKLLRRSCLRFWTRAWGQRELADERTGRLKSPVDCRTCSRVGWTSLPLTSNSAHFAGNTRSGRWTRRSGSRAGRERIAVFADSSLLLEEAPPVVHQLVEPRPGHSAVPFRDGRPFPEAQISWSTRAVRLRDG